MSSTSKSGEVKIWHFKSDLRPFRYTRHRGAVYCCDYSPCGKYLATGGHDGKIFIWKNVVEGDKFHIKFTAHAGPVKSVKFSKDGNFLISGGDDKMVKLWKISKNYKKSKFLRTFKGHTNWVLKADISPDSTIVASICDKTIRIWDASTGNQFLRYMNVVRGNQCLEFHPDGNYIGISGSSGIIQIWDTRANKLAHIYETNESVNEIAFHPSGQFLAAAFDYIERENNSVLKIFDIRQGRCIYKISGIYGSLYGLKFSINGDYLASGGEEKLVYVWKTNFKPLKALDRENEAELEEIEKDMHQKQEKEIFIGGALSLQQNSLIQENQKKTRAYEKLTMTLENLVTSVNSISLNMRHMGEKMEKNQKRAKDLFKIISFREMLNGGKDPQFDTRGFLTQNDSNMVSFKENQENSSSRNFNTNLYNYSESLNFSQVNPVTVTSKEILEGSLTTDLQSMTNPFIKGNLANHVEFDSEISFKNTTSNYEGGKRFHGEGEIVSNIEKERIQDDRVFESEIPGGSFGAYNSFSKKEPMISENIEYTYNEDELRDTVEKPLKKSGGTLGTDYFFKSEIDEEIKQSGLGPVENSELIQPTCYKITEFVDRNLGSKRKQREEISFAEFKSYFNSRQENIEVDMKNFTVKIILLEEEDNTGVACWLEETKIDLDSGNTQKQKRQIPYSEYLSYAQRDGEDGITADNESHIISVVNYTGGDQLLPQGKLGAGPEIIKEEPEEEEQEIGVKPVEADYYIKYVKRFTNINSSGIGMALLENQKIKKENFDKSEPENDSLYRCYSKQGNLIFNELIESKHVKNYLGDRDYEDKTYKLVRFEVIDDDEKIVEERDISFEEFANFEKKFVPKFRDFLIKREKYNLFVYDIVERGKEVFELQQPDYDSPPEKRKMMYGDSWVFQKARKISDEHKE